MHFSALNQLGGWCVQHGTTARGSSVLQDTGSFLPVTGMFSVRIRNKQITTTTKYFSEKFLNKQTNKKVQFHGFTFG